ncbi:MAG: hypothetical protein V8R82_12005 [Clostridia bacterium]
MRTTVLHQILQQEPRNEISRGNSETIEDKENIYKSSIKKTVNQL